MKYNSAKETTKHIRNVRRLLRMVEADLEVRGYIHDRSKLHKPEKEIFDEMTPKLKGCTYGSDEYKGYLKEMNVALQHHYAENRHHPEHFKYYECIGCFKRFYEEPNRCDVCGYSQFQIRSDITQMNLIDLIEMLMDWKAATLRHADGDILRSIELNQKRFEYSDGLKKIFLNTIEYLDLENEPQRV